MPDPTVKRDDVARCHETLIGFMLMLGMGGWKHPPKTEEAARKKFKELEAMLHEQCACRCRRKCAENLMEKPCEPGLLIPR